MTTCQIKVGVVRCVGWGEDVSAQWIEALRNRGVECVEVDPLATDLTITLQDLHGLMWRLGNKPPDRVFGETLLVTFAHGLGLPVYPSVPMYWHYDDKIRQYYLCKAVGVAMPKTWVFWRYEDAMRWIPTAKLPLVSKLAIGAGSQNVTLLRSPIEVRRVVEAAFRGGIWPRDEMTALKEGRNLWMLYREARRFARRVCDLLRLKAVSEPMVREFLDSRPEQRYVLFQDFIEGNTGDTRITVIGDKAFGFRRLNRPGDFRASGSGLIEYDPSQIDMKFIRFAFDASQRLNAEVMTYDCLNSATGAPVTCEVSYTFLHRAVAACPGYWSRAGKWMSQPQKPAELQVDLFLNRIRRNINQPRRRDRFTLG